MMRSHHRKIASDTSHEHVKGPCPFCHQRGGTIDCDFTGAHNNSGKPVLAHSLPTCATYDRMTADEFVQAVINREHLQ